MASPSEPLVGRLFQGVDKKSTAFKLMKSMGWEEGTGLGREKQGISTHVRVAKKHDNAGLGIAEAKKSTSEWTVNTAVFDNILKNLQIHATSNQGKDKKKQNEESDESASSSEEDSESKSGYESESESDSESDSDSDSDSSSGEKSKKNSEQEISPPKKTAVKIARPQGRYKKREAGKAVNLYSSTDLKAILGHGAPESTPTPKSKEVTANKKLTPVPSPFPSYVSLPKLPPDWWGSKYGFVRAGQLGSASESKEIDSITAGKIEGSGPKDEERVKGFREEDQENLYNLVQDNATSGRRGLGISDLPKKVAGARWKGSKVLFGEDDEGENEGTNGGKEGEDSEEKEELEGHNSEETKGKRKRKSDGGEKEGKSSKKEKKSGKVQQIVENFEWKKVILKALKESDSQKLEMKKLKKKVISQLKEELGELKVEKELLQKCFLEKLNSVKKVSLKDGFVKLKSKK